MKITKLLLKNNRIQIFIDDEYSFSCTQNFVIENRLYKDQEVSLDELEILKSDAKYSIVEFKLLEYIYRGYYSHRELKIKISRYCQKRFDFVPDEVFFQKAFEKLEKSKIYNSQIAAQNLVRIYLERSKGKNYIYSKLLAKGFIKEEIENSLKEIDLEKLEDKLQKLLEKKFDNLTKNETLDKYQLKQKLYKFGISKGFNYGEIKKVVETLVN